MNDTQEKNMRIIDSYLKYFSNRKIHYPKSDEFIKKYRQPGDGYIDVANCMNNEGISHDKECSDFYRYLLALNDYHKFSAFKYMNDNEVDEMKVFDVSTDKTICEPNQKFHLIVAYLGIWLYWIEVCDKKTQMNYKNISCPELLLWIAEGCAVDLVYEIYDNAVKYKEELITYDEWRNKAKQYWKRFDEIVLAHND